MLLRWAVTSCPFTATLRQAIGKRAASAKFCARRRALPGGQKVFWHGWRLVTIEDLEPVSEPVSCELMAILSAAKNPRCLGARCFTALRMTAGSSRPVRSDSGRCCCVAVRPLGDCCRCRRRGENAAGLAFFEAKIRPVLVEKCYSCHSSEADELKGGLHLDSRDGILTGGDSGPAAVPGNPAESMIIQALHYDGYEMPPTGKLPKETIANFEHWIEMGMPDPREGTSQRPSARSILRRAGSFGRFSRL